MLESPAALPAITLNAKSSKVTPADSPVTCSAYPATVGAITANLLAL
jgi:hypothetical protein